MANITKINGKDVKDSTAVHMASLATIESNTTATTAHEIGSYFWLNEILYETTTAIAVGDTIIVGTNCKEVILGDDIADLKSQIQRSSRNKFAFAEIAFIVKAGNADKWFGIGDQIITTWNDGTTEYDMPWDIVHIGPVVNASGNSVPGLWLQSHYAIPGVQYDASEAIYVAQEILPAGDYYFTFGSTFGEMKSGKSYTFTTTKAIPIGGQIVVGTADNFYIWDSSHTPDTWRVYTFSEAASITPLDAELTLTEGTAGTFLGSLTIDIAAGTSNPNNLIRAANGYARWSQSAVRQWLNSDAAAGAWWEPQNVFDRPSVDVALIRGFMAGLPADFKAVINPVKVTTAISTDVDGGGTDETFDRFFLASLEQEYFVPVVSGAEGEYWEYWKQRLGLEAPQNTGKSGANVTHIRFEISTHSTARDNVLRSLADISGNSRAMVRYIAINGGAYSLLPMTSRSIAPACVIC